MSERRPTAKQRQSVAARAQHGCEYCRTPVAFSPDPFSVEHIVPFVLSGPTHLDNLALSCQGCNNAKYISTEAADPLTGQMAPLFHPRRQVWQEHFQWSANALLVVGKTPTGRATVEKLHLNRPGLVNLRRVLSTAGFHPPI